VIETPAKPPNICYFIRFTYQADVKAAQAAAWRVAETKRKAEQAEIALHQAESAKAHNNHYVAQGDLSIGPLPPDPAKDAIWDDGYTTTLTFPGNMRIPAIYTRLDDKKTDAQVNGITVESGGVVRIHGTFSFLRLRDGDLTLCIFNRAYSAVGNNPGTGTISPSVDRTVGPASP
jgi:type IV secretion system protein VirB9